jgi:gliding motility-associated lipoprotein GldD
MRAIILGFIGMLFSCSQPSLPKPAGFLALEYPKAQYQFFQSDCSFQFQFNRLSAIHFTKGCDLEIQYPFMKATIFLTHLPVKNNLGRLYEDVQKKLDEQSLGTTRVHQSAFEDAERNLVGSLFTIEADAASNVQFFVTDKQNNFVSGSIYIETKPNYDSLLPTLEYLKKDIRKLVQTFEWKEML